MTAPAPTDHSFSLFGVLTIARQRLEAAAIDSATLDARLLLQHVSGLTQGNMIADPDQPLPKAWIDEYDKLIARRLRREPVSRIIGRRSFYDADYLIDRSTLDPRPDSETLVEHAKAIVAMEDARVLDLGTGSGCLLIALLRQHPRWLGMGVDIQSSAIRMARVNAARLGVGTRTVFRQGRWYQPLAATDIGGFDLIISNPPYIATAVQEMLMPEVRDYDPAIALFAGSEGLDAYRHIVPNGRRFLKPDGWMICEIGYDQEHAVRDIYAAAGFEDIMLVPDLGDGRV